MRKQHGRVLVIGSANMDIIAVADELPGKGEYVYGSALHFVPGGNGLNVAVAAARLGSRVQFVGFVGDDAFGRELSVFMKGEGVDTVHLGIMKGSKSGTVLSSLSSKEERHIVFPGSNMQISADMLPSLDIGESDVVLSQLTIPQGAIRKGFEAARKAGARTILNVFPNYELDRSLLPLTDYIILNEVELAFRTGGKGVDNARHRDMYMDCAEVRKRANMMRSSEGQVVITTLGKRGLMAIVGNRQIKIDGIKVKLVDATGAGDCFMGAFATRLIEGSGLEASLAFANCAAALSVQKVGTTTSFPRRDDVNQLLKKAGSP